MVQQRVVFTQDTGPVENQQYSEAQRAGILTYIKENTMIGERRDGTEKWEFNYSVNIYTSI